MRISIGFSRVSAGTVFTDNGGFRLLLSQPNEFPLLQVFGLKATFLSNMQKLIFDASKIVSSSKIFSSRRGTYH